MSRLTISPVAVRPVAVRPVVVRSLELGDDTAVRRLFADTVGLGHQLSFPVKAFAQYQSLCLDWYLGPGREDGAVAMENDSAVCGYALVCTRPLAYQRWLRRRAMGFLAAAALPATRRNDSGRFLRLRVADGWHTWRDPFPQPMAAHAHLNLAHAERAGRAGRMLVDHIDERCRLAGLPGWFGEVNAPVGRRAAALERLGARVVHRVPNHTLSWVCRQPVERLTVVRQLRVDQPTRGQSARSPAAM